MNFLAHGAILNGEKMLERLCRHVMNGLVVMVLVACSPASTEETGAPQAVAPAQIQMSTAVACGLIDYKDHDRTVRSVQSMYQQQQFSTLESMLNCLMSNPQRFSSGKLGASAVYWAFRRQMPAPGIDPAVEAARIKNWQQAYPDSIFAKFAFLRLMYGMAWLARGGGYVQETSRSSMQEFLYRLAETESSMLKVEPALRNTPIWYNLMLAVSQDSPNRITNPREIFNQGVNQWPLYYDFYEVALSRLVPRWGGSWVAVDSFVNYWAKAMRETEGDSMYARLYISVVRAGERPSDTAIDWPRMKASLDDLVTRYPDPMHKNMAVNFACMYGDMDYLKLSMSRVQFSDLRPEYWLPGVDPSCRSIPSFR